MWGMNLELPHFPGGTAAQFWWISGIMAIVSGAMLVVFRMNKWI
jgi:predicted cobalt transporter CbtA